MTGCGTPGAPQPPSLKLPQPVTDLSAVRTGNEVTLHWTMPRKTTDRLRIQSAVEAQICWRTPTETCRKSGNSYPPGTAVDFTSTLPTPLTEGEPRPVSFFVELISPKGRSAGLSNPAQIVAGKAPAPVSGLSGEPTAEGVALHWQGGETGSVRLHRKLLTPLERRTAERKTEAKSGPMQPAPEPLERDLFVEAPAVGSRAGALDHTARFGVSYAYTAQRVERITANGAALELAGPVSAPVRIDVGDTFPPAVPQGLVAVLAAEEKTIDLSWQPDTNEDLEGYIVYRTETDGDWKRISGVQVVAGPAYRDAKIEAGHSYRYAVTAIDTKGNESKRSAEAHESFPNP